jgi:hypothetical protein
LITLREPLKIHFGGQANLLASGQCQEEADLASTKPDLPSLPEAQNLLLAAQKQLLELPLIKSKSCIQRKKCPLTLFFTQFF